MKYADLNWDEALTKFENKNIIKSISIVSVAIINENETHKIASINSMENNFKWQKQSILKIFYMT